MHAAAHWLSLQQHALHAGTRLRNSAPSWHVARLLQLQAQSHVGTKNTHGLQAHASQLLLNLCAAFCVARRDPSTQAGLTDATTAADISTTDQSIGTQPQPHGDDARWCDAPAADDGRVAHHDAAQGGGGVLAQSHARLAVLSAHNTGTNNSIDLEATSGQPTIATLNVREREECADTCTRASAMAPPRRPAYSTLALGVPSGGGELMMTALRVLAEAPALLDGEARENCLEVLAALLQLPDSTTEKDPAVC